MIFSPFNAFLCSTIQSHPQLFCLVSLSDIMSSTDFYGKNFIQNLSNAALSIFTAQNLKQTSAGIFRPLPTPFNLQICILKFAHALFPSTCFLPFSAHLCYCCCVSGLIPAFCLSVASTLASSIHNYFFYNSSHFFQ